MSLNWSNKSRTFLRSQFLKSVRTFSKKVRDKKIIVVVVLLFLFLSLLALNFAEKETRDLKRKGDIADLQKALYLHYQEHRTYPPINASTFCGNINTPENENLKKTIEYYLRQDPNYEKGDKSFPSDPKFFDSNKDYFYWKTGEASFMLLSELERDNNNERPTELCRKEGNTFDYAVDQTTEVELKVKRLK